MRVAYVRAAVACSMRTHLIVFLRILRGILLQNLDDLVPALDAYPGTRRGALGVVEPRLQLVDGHVDLLVELCDDLVFALDHGDALKSKLKTRPSLSTFISTPRCMT